MSGEKQLGQVTASGYTTFSFRSGELVSFGSLVEALTPEGFSTVGQVVEAAAERDGSFTYTASVCGLVVWQEDGPRADAVRAVPVRAGSAVRFASPAAVTCILGLEADPGNFLFLGRTGGADALLSPRFLFRHLLVCGVTGSGKSHFVKVILEELGKLRTPAVVVDALGEYREVAGALGGAALVPGKDFVVPLSSLTSEEAAYSVAALRGTPAYELFLFSFSALLKEIEGGRRAGFDLGDLVARMEVDGRDTLRMPGSEFRPAIARVEASIGRLGFIGPARYRLDWGRVLGRGGPAVVVCSALDLAQLRLMAGATLRELQRLRRTGKVPPFVLVVDEAHLVAPVGEDVPCKQVIREYIRMGRHDSVGMVVVTQSPGDLDAFVAALCATKALFAVEPGALGPLRETALPHGGLRAVASLPRGSCILLGTRETVRHPFVLEVRDMRAGNSVTAVSANTAKQVQTSRKNTTEEWWKSIGHKRL